MPTPNTAATTIESPDIQPATLGRAATPPLLKPCDSSYTVKVWRHQWEDMVAAENTEEGSRTVKTYRWTTQEGSYVREEEQISSENFSSEYYNFLGWTLLRK